MEQGRKDGRQEGRIDGLRESLVKLLIGRFGQLPAEITAKVKALNESQLDAALERFVSAQTLREMNL